ncbi:glycosyltransferase family 1 protein [Dysgonomonas sp. 216]|uniref:glycosyltransferase family 4 protein n=1 Tax=Dysgonomonas sp. 216 TaxID=2302934 RepID=UPI0013D503C4|nr:glycosyltransferase family 4 protein [Dysgonomonas sp. 216]NDW17369.1 glycosyltransferase family 1 protein [Dysgonomonas sp. 216]
MKIVHVIFSLKTGGSETMLVDIINEQVNSDNDLELIIINDEYENALVDKIDKRVKISYMRRVRGRNTIFVALKLNMYAVLYRPDVVHFHDHTGIGMFFYQSFKKVLTVHAIGFNSKYWRRYDAICSISNAVKEDLKNRIGIDSSLVYNGISFKTIKQKQISSKNKAELRLLQISRLDHQTKGQDILIDAIKLVAGKYFGKISVDFIGEGDSRSYLEAKVLESGLSDSIRFLGLKSRDYIYEHLNEYDLLVQPSVYEGFGLAIAEGIAAKIPVLISDNKGPMEVIAEGKYGFVFKNGDSIDCAEKIIQIAMMSDDKIRMLTQDAFLYAEKMFNIENTAQNYLNLYKD